MSFHLKRERRVGRQIRHVLERQVAGALGMLQAPEASAEREAVHEARKHIKKAEAALQLVRGSLGHAYRGVKRRLRMANRRLNPYADAWAVVETLDHLQDFNPLRLPVATIETLRAHLVARAKHVDGQIEFGRVRERLVRLLVAEVPRIEQLDIKAGPQSVVRGIARAHNAAHDAMIVATAQPSARSYHRWRQRVKTEWYLFRLVGEWCGNQLAADERRLEGLDWCLGELHNVSTLLKLIVDDSPISRRDTADTLLALREYRRELRHRARLMGRIYAERSGHLAARLGEVWGSALPEESDPSRTEPWPRVA